MNKIVKETLENLRIDNVLTSVYHPQSNARVERSHRTLYDFLSKTLADNKRTWHMFLNQALAAMRYNLTESSKFSLFYFLYFTDVVLPIDNLLKPRRKYQGEKTHKIGHEKTGKVCKQKYQSC